MVELKRLKEVLEEERMTSSLAQDMKAEEPIVG